MDARLLVLRRRSVSYTRGKGAVRSGSKLSGGPEPC